MTRKFAAHIAWGKTPNHPSKVFLVSVGEPSRLLMTTRSCKSAADFACGVDTALILLKRFGQ